MRHHRRLAVAIVLASPSVAAGQAPELVRRPLVAEVTNGSIAGTTATVWVDRGARDGVVDGAVGLAAYHVADDMMPADIGTARVIAVRNRRTQLAIELLPDATVQVGDHVALQAVLPASTSIGYDLAALGIELRTEIGSDEILNPWSAYRDDPAAIADADLCEQAAVRVRTWGAELAALPDFAAPIPEGAFAGRTAAEVIPTVTADDACSGFAYLLTLEPRIFTHDEQTVGGIVFTWVMAGGSVAPRELRRRAEGLDDAAFAELVRKHEGDLAFTWHWAGEAEQAVRDGRLDEADALVAIARRFADATGKPYDRAWALVIEAERRWADRDATAIDLLRAGIEAHPPLRGDLLARIGAIQHELGDLEAADASFAEAGENLGGRWETRGDQLRAQDRFEEALDAYRRGLAWHDARSDAYSDYRAAWCQEGVAASLTTLGRHDEADAAYVELARRADAYGYAWLAAQAHAGRARVALAAGRPAEELAFRAAERFQELGEHVEVASVLWVAAQDAMRRGDLAGAEHWLDEALEQVRISPDAQQLAKILDALAQLELQTGDPVAAIALIDEALAALGPEGDAEPRADLWLQRSAAWEAAARPDLARDDAERARAVAAEGGVVSTEALALLQLGLYERNPDRIEEAVAIWREVPVWGRTWIVTAEASLSELAIERGDLDGALAHAQASVAAAESPRDIAGAQIALGEAHEAREDVQDARDAFQAAWDGYAAIGDVAGAFDAGVSLAILSLDVRSPEQAIAAADRFLGYQEGREDAFDDVGTLHLVRALALLALGRVDEAVVAAHEARRGAVAVESAANEAQALLVLAEVDLLRGDATAALRQAERAARLADTDTHQASRLVAWSTLSRVRLANGDAEGALAAAEEAVRIGRSTPTVRPGSALAARAEAKLAVGDVEGAHADVVDGLAATTGPRWGAARDELRIALAGVHRARGDVQAAREALAAIEATPQTDRLVLARADVVRVALGDAPLAPIRLPKRPPSTEAATLRDAVLALEATVPDLPERMPVPASAFEAIQADLLPGEAFVQPVVLPDRIVLFVVRGGREPVFREVAADEGEVARRVTAMREALQTPGASWETTRGVRVAAATSADPAAASRALHDLLIAPIRADLDGVDTLIFGLGGRLRYVPLAALFDGERYLVEAFRVALLTSSGATTKHRPIQRRSTLLALANPDASLPGAEAEVAAIARTWGRGRATTHVGAAATEDALRDEVDHARILHLATHGVLDEAAPRESYLLLASEHGEERLTLREITTLPLGSVDLAVLSACQTAVGELGEGREIAGLAYQFEVRGTAAVMASLWSVDDEATRALMTRMYAKLKRRGATRSGSLRDAQLALLADPETRHPYYWAAFVLIGDWR